MFYTLLKGCLNKAAAAKIVCRSFTGVRKHTSVILLQLHISRNIQTCSTHFFPKTSETSILLGTKQHSFCIYNHNRNKLLSQQFSSQKRLYSTIPVSPSYRSCELKYETNINSPDYDGIILVTGFKPGTEEPEVFKSVLSGAAEIDCDIFKRGAVLPIDLPAKRLIYSPTGPINPDCDDVRSFGEAATKGIKRALAAGVKKPLLVLLPDKRFENAELVTLLGALQGAYVPMEIRESNAEKASKVKCLSVWSPSDSKKIESIVNQALVLESGRCVARDIGGCDPERMAPPRVEEYVRQLFQDTKIDIEVIEDPTQLLSEYPLFACVNRAASVIPRHAGRIIYMNYEPSNPNAIKETLVLIGKGVTYDTGGADIKTGGHMTGMCHDKCGAAAVAGFMQIVNLLQPPHTRVVAGIGVTRNSVGENSYVTDEVITAKCGARVRVTNTDAEGRFVMADIIHHLKEKYKDSPNVKIFSIATLTGHARSMSGVGYSVVMDNAVARAVENAQQLQRYSEIIGEPLEISNIRREDYEAHKGKAEGDDLVQTGRKIGGVAARGHQAAAAFLVMSSGLDKNGKESEKPLMYSHLDIAGGSGNWPEQPTAAPILALASRFFGAELKEFSK